MSMLLGSNVPKYGQLYICAVPSNTGIKRYILQNGLVGAKKRFVAVVSGANMNFSRLRFVSERAELGEGREVLLSVDIPEKPGR